MKYIIRVENLENIPETRPLVAMDNIRKLLWRGKQSRYILRYIATTKHPMEEIIEEQESYGNIYVGPNILSHEAVGETTDGTIYEIEFDGPVTAMGVWPDDPESEEPQYMFGPWFVNQSEEDSSIISVEIPNTVTSINNATFANCNRLSSIIIPNSVTSIGDAFYGCTSLPVVDNIRYADTYLVEVVDKTLSTYNIKPGTKWIRSQAFYECGYLRSMVIPNSVTSIGDLAFHYCLQLTSVTIGNNVTSIGVEAFGNCTSLASMTIPNSVTSIENYAFFNCHGLTSITCEATTPPTLGESGVFDDTNNCPIYVPSQSVNAYKAATNWSEYASRIQAIQE